MKLFADKYYGAWLSFFILALMPLVIRIVDVAADPLIAAFTSERVTTDAFYYFRGIILVLGVTGVFISIMFNRLLGTVKFKIDQVLKIMMVMAMIVLVTSVASPYRSVAIAGFRDHYEGTYVWLAYLMIFVIAYLNSRIIEEMKSVLPFVATSVSVVSLVGILQYFGINIMNSSWFKYLVLPVSLWSSKGDHFSQPFVAYSFLGNSNYVGTYTAMMIPLMMLGMLRQKGWGRIIMATAMTLCCVFLAVSHSEAGYVAFSGIVGGGAFLGIVKRNWRLIQATAIALLSFVGILVLYNNGTTSVPFYTYVAISPVIGSIYYVILGPDISKRFKAMFLAALVLGMGVAVFYLRDYESDSWKISDKYTALNLTSNLAVLEERNPSGEIKTYSIKRTTNGFTLSALGNTFLVSEKDIVKGKTFEWPASSFEIAVSQKGGKYVIFELLPIHLRLVYDGVNFAAVTGGGQLVRDQNPDQYGHFFKDESLGSSRAFIWNRSFSAINRSLILGSGPDTYPFQFPQEDILGKLNSAGIANLVVDKPHNLFLQLSITLGVPFVLMVLYLFFRPCFASVKESMSIEFYLLGMSALGFLVTGLFNDSTIPTGMIFWFVLGSYYRLSESN